MTETSGDDVQRLLYLEDLHVGQRSTTRTHTLDESQIVSFASQFDPQRFTSMPPPRATRCSAGWWQAAGTPPRSRCGSWLPKDCLSRGGWSAERRRSAGPGRHVRAMPCGSRARCSRSRLRDPAPTAASSRFAARRAISGMKWSRSWWPRWSCRAGRARAKAEVVGCLPQLDEPLRQPLARARDHGRAVVREEVVPAAGERRVRVAACAPRTLPRVQQRLKTRAGSDPEQRI